MKKLTVAVIAVAFLVPSVTLAAYGSYSFGSEHTDLVSYTYVDAEYRQLKADYKEYCTVAGEDFEDDLNSISTTETKKAYQARADIRSEYREFDDKCESTVNKLKSHIRQMDREGVMTDGEWRDACKDEDLVFDPIRGNCQSEKATRGEVESAEEVVEEEPDEEVSDSNAVLQERINMLMQIVAELTKQLMAQQGESAVKGAETERVQVTLPSSDKDEEIGEVATKTKEAEYTELEEYIISGIESGFSSKNVMGSDSPLTSFDGFTGSKENRIWTAIREYQQKNPDFNLRRLEWGGEHSPGGGYVRDAGVQNIPDWDDAEQVRGFLDAFKEWVENN